MAINIKEILTTDTDSIKVDKTNYNFDQLIANGGGPIGIKGQKGELGGVGTTGNKGEKGEEGAKGDQGATGADVNNWGRINYDSATATSILKPKKDGDDTEPTSIILGDTGYADGVTDGIADPTAWLNIVLPDSSAFYSNFASLLTGTTSVLNISSSTLNSVDTYKITHGTSTNDVNFEINIDNEILINAANAINITTTAGPIGINAGNQDIVLGPGTGTSTAKLDVRFDDTFVRGDLTVDTTGFVKIPVGTVAQRPTGALGMIRYNSELEAANATGGIEAFVPGAGGNYWKPISSLVDADGDTFISPDFNVNNGTENVITIGVGYDTGGGSFTSETVATIGETVGDGSANLIRTFKYNNIIHAVDDILVDNDSGLRIRQNTTAPGGSQVNAANNGVAAANRTFADYFYRESALQYDVITLTSQPITGVTTNLSVDKYSNDVLIGHEYDPIVGAGNSELSIGIIINGNTTKMSYVKVGHMVNVWGRIDMYAKPVDTGELESGDWNLNPSNSASSLSPAPRAGFKIGGASHFPYTSALVSERVIFPIAINPHDATNASAGLTKRYFGVIFPGTNIFNILEVNDLDGMLPTEKVEGTGEGYYLSVADLIKTGTIGAGGNSNTYPMITIDYNFNMPVDESSYDLGSDTHTAYIEDQTAQQTS